MNIQVLLTPRELPSLESRDLSRTICVVFDVLRATTTLVTALSHGATAILPVRTVEEALEMRKRMPEVLLAGERNGLRIEASQTGSIGFDLGNSPREFTRARVAGRRIAATTTNGTRALQACRHADQVLACSFANLGATASRLQKKPDRDLLVVCSGTGEEPAFEDLLGAGALVEMVLKNHQATADSDSAWIARKAYHDASGNLAAAIGESQNGRRLLGLADLREDVAICSQIDSHPLVAQLDAEGWLIRATDAQ